MKHSPHRGWMASRRTFSEQEHSQEMHVASRLATEPLSPKVCSSARSHELVECECLESRGIRRQPVQPPGSSSHRRHALGANAVSRIRSVCIGRSSS